MTHNFYQMMFRNKFNLVDKMGDRQYRLIKENQKQKNGTVILRL